MNRRFLRGCALAVLGTAGAVACGGSSTRDGASSAETGGDAGDSGSGGTSGTGNAGGTPRGGSGGAPGSSGSPTGGMSGAAGTSGSVGTSGVGGMGATSGSAGASGANGTCSLTPEAGPCDALFYRYAFDMSTGLCRPFVYGGCGGNANNFETVEDCYAECGTEGELNPAACQTSRECALMPAACCGECIEATLTNVVAIRAGQEDAVEAAMECNIVGDECAPCDAPPPNPWLGATCRAGRCVPFDARQTELTECASPEECVLRAGVQCCEVCAGGSAWLVSLNGEADLSSWACGSDDASCPPCVPTEPMDIAPSCDNGRCTIQGLPL